MATTMRYIPKSISKLHRDVIPIKGIGSYVYSEKGKKYLDYTSGIGALSTGHSHPYVIKRVSEQLDKIVHAPQQIFGTHCAQIKLTRRLMDIAPSKSLNSVFYTSSGSEATDNAIKIARRYTGKTNIIALTNGFHGRTLGALSVTSSGIACKYRSQPLIPGVFFCEPTIESLCKTLNHNTSLSETACVIFEPVQGEGGVHDIPAEFLRYLSVLCKCDNVMMIADEVQCGFGRTGTMWNVERKGVVPDILTFGKGIASGFPLSGVISKDSVMDGLGLGYMGGTYGGNAISSIAASATIDVMHKDNLLYNTNVMGTYIGNKLKSFENINEVRQYGLMIAFSFKDIQAMEIVSKLRNDKDILVLLAGNANQYIRILPPLNTTKEEADIFLNGLADVVQ